MEFTPRFQQILLIMLDMDQAVPVKKLAEVIRVSKRTVQRELEYIDRPLKKYGINFCSKTGIGVWLEGSQEAKQRLLQELRGEEQVDHTDRNERRKRLVLEILKDRALKKLYYYSDMLGVSEATIRSDLECVESWFEIYDLKIMRKQGLGVSIQGSEKDYRRAMRAFIEENLNSQLIRDFYEDRNVSIMKMFKNKADNHIYGILDSEIFERVVDCFFRLDDKRIISLTEDSYFGLILHVTIAINRILKDEIIEENWQLLIDTPKDEDYELALYIVRALEAEFTIHVPEIESVYICLHIKGAKRQYIDHDGQIQSLMDENNGLLELLDQMIDAYDFALAMPLKQDDDFIKGLLAHMQPTLVRLQNGMKISNPMLSDIKKDYWEIYKKCERVAAVIERSLDCKVPESEVGFLAIHFGAAIGKLENQRESRRKVRIGMVCASGIGISRLMSTKVNKNFAGRVDVTAYAKNDLTPYVLKKIDFLVSSISLEDIGREVVFVNPMLVDKDLDNIEDKIRKYEYSKKEEEKEDTFSLQLEQVNFMTSQIKSLINRMKVIRVDHNITFDELVIAVSEEQARYSDQQQMIQNDIWAREKLSSQIFPHFGFALLHTRTKGVVSPCFSVYITKDSQSFKDDYLAGISVVIVMLLPQDSHIKENSELLGYLSEMLIEEDAFLETIITGKSDAIRELLSKYLKRFFIRYIEKI